jgi:hypothetical protein
VDIATPQAETILSLVTVDAIPQADAIQQF